MKYNAHIKFSFFYLNNKNEIKKLKSLIILFSLSFSKKKIKQHQHKKTTTITELKEINNNTRKEHEENRIKNNNYIKKLLF